MTHHALAVAGLTATALNLLGALYLAYDLLGGRHGPLRALTRAVTYSALFFFAYATVLPARFAIFASIGAGATLGVEFTRAARHARPSRRHDVLASAIRGLCYAIGSGLIFGRAFGAAFGAMTTAGQIVQYRMGFTPLIGLDARHQLRKHLIGAVNRTVGFAIAAFASGLIAGQQDRAALLFGVAMGAAIGVVSVSMGIICPFVERWADQLPQRRLGIFGALLICCGFVLDSLENVLTLLDIPIR